MRSTRRSICSSLSATFLLLFLTFSITATIARADDAEDGDEYDVTARVVRISLIAGDVSLKRNGNTDWERARLNTPLVEGDAISTDRDSRVELQIDARNFVRLGANSMLKIVTLRDEGVALSVVEGTASIRLAKFDRDHEYFEIDAPKTTLAAEKKGLYRIDVSRDGRVQLSARDGGRARIYSETSGFELRDSRTAELIFEGDDAGDWQFIASDAADSWDNWVRNRERFLAERSRYDTQYYDSYVWGGEDLDSYGDWTYAGDYGWIWRPHTTVVNIYNDWAPYRYGYWTWVSPYGWTWVGQEPWGWAPYHYGRWVYYNNYWAWCPRSQYYSHRSWWRPALVAFNISFGNNVCWYPLQYHQRDPYSRYYHNDNRLRPLRADEIARLQRVNPAYYRAVTALAAKDFGADGVRARPADDVVARRVFNANPLRTDLPVRPAYAPGDRTAGERQERVTVARPARVAPPSELRERPTGASDRRPGVPLDNELRRTRVLNGREGVVARPEFPVTTSGVGPVETRPTGAVMRPVRSPRELPPRATDGDRNTGPVDERPPRTDRVRPREVPREEVNERERAPVRTPSNEAGAPDDRPARPERVDRPQAPPRNDSPPRYEPPVRNDPPPRNDPSPRYEPPVRNDPPPRHDPTPRNDPPPRSEPPPRSDPPPRSEPSQRSEPREEHDRAPAKVKDPR